MLPFFFVLNVHAPIKRLLTVRDITRSGFSIDDLVYDLVNNDAWRWPIDWYTRLPELTQAQIPLLHVMMMMRRRRISSSGKTYVANA